MTFHELFIRIKKTVEYEIVGFCELLIEPFHDGVLFMHAHMLEFMLRIEIFMHYFESEVFCYCLSFILGHPLLMFIVYGLNIVLNTE